MLQLGKTQELTVIRFTDNGAYLGENLQAEKQVLLPKKYVPAGTETGNRISVFLYKDSEDRWIATTLQPLLEVGSFGYLKVAQVTKVGAFLSWGLSKDLFLPYKEQRGELRPGQEVLVSVYVDKSERLSATMYVDRYFRSDSPYRKGDRVSGRIYGVHPEIGAFVAVDDIYYGLIPRQELYEKVRIGDCVEARVLQVRPDGKLNLSIREKAYRAMDGDSLVILEHIKAAGGILGLGDKTDAVFIQAELSMSKSAFKRAAGHLMKAGKIRIFDDRIELSEEI